jgi:hypothetical protein
LLVKLETSADPAKPFGERSPSETVSVPNVDAFDDGKFVAVVDARRSRALPARLAFRGERGRPLAGMNIACSISERPAGSCRSWILARDLQRLAAGDLAFHAGKRRRERRRLADRIDDASFEVMPERRRARDRSSPRSQTWHRGSP